MRILWPTSVFICTILFFGVLYWLGDYSASFWTCMHFSVDTITLRGRLPEPEDRWCAFLSDVQALATMAIVVVWFGWIFGTWKKAEPEVAAFPPLQESLQHRLDAIE